MKCIMLLFIKTRFINDLSSCDALYDISRVANV